LRSKVPEKTKGVCDMLDNYKPKKESLMYDPQCH